MPYTPCLCGDPECPRCGSAQGTRFALVQRCAYHQDSSGWDACSEDFEGACDRGIPRSPLSRSVTIALGKTYLLPCSINLRSCRPANGTTWTLAELYALLDCTMIEVVYLEHEQILIIDEEGKLRDEPVINPIATVLAHELNALDPQDYIAGTCILCPSEMLQ